MPSDQNATLDQVLAELDGDLGGVLKRSSARPVPRPAHHKDVADTALAYFVDGHDPDAGIVLLLSSPGYPGMVRRNVEQAASIAAAL